MREWRARSCLAAAQRTALREGEPSSVLAAIRTLPMTEAQDGAVAGRVQAEVLGHLIPRQAQMRYDAFRTQGMPISSGRVESANKLVVEARLKGAELRWAERHVTPLAALRGALCAERWDEAWAVIAQARSPQTRQSRSAPAPTPVASAASVAAPAPPSRAPAIAALPRPGPKTIVNGRSTAHHPWKRRQGAARSSARL